MEAKELMIGDWVLALDSTHKEKVFVQVDAIEEGKRSVLVTRDCSNWFVDIDWIEPIPLTIEHLEKNGTLLTNIDLEIYSLDGLILSYDESQSNFDIGTVCYGFSGEEFVYVTTIDYVHQLQHALRLCGIKKEIVL